MLDKGTWNLHKIKKTDEDANRREIVKDIEKLWGRKRTKSANNIKDGWRGQIQYGEI